MQEKQMRKAFGSKATFGCGEGAQRPAVPLGGGKGLKVMQKLLCELPFLCRS